MPPCHKCPKRIDCLVRENCDGFHLLNHPISFGKSHIKGIGDAIFATYWFPEKVEVTYVGPFSKIVQRFEEFFSDDYPRYPRYPFVV